MITLGGNVCIRNGLELDYCWREAISSLLPVCDEVVVCDGESTDGTQKLIRDWMEEEPKIKLCVYKWKDPKGDIDFWVNWLNYARHHVRSHFMIQLDADEILCSRSYPELERIKALGFPQRFSLWCERLNFWKDHRHLIPHGVCLGHRVVRVAPQNVWLPSDGPHPKGAEAVMMAREPQNPIRIFHYGFLRRHEAFFKKARAIQRYFWNSYDERLELQEGNGNWMEDIENVEWINRLVPYDGPHPIHALAWLTERGYL